MILFTPYDQEGRLVAPFYVSSEIDVISNSPHGYLDGHHDPETTYALNGEPEPRPSLIVPKTQSLSTNVDWNLGELPEDSIVLIEGEEKGHTDTTALVLSFDFPGTYTLEIEPPFPWRKATCEVTVT